VPAGPRPPDRPPVFCLPPAQWAAIPLGDRETRDGRRYTYLFRTGRAPDGGYQEIPGRVGVHLRTRIPVGITGACPRCGAADPFAMERLSVLVCILCGAPYAGGGPDDWSDDHTPPF
jgi:hypothetical protein